jgi:hypothetical protein
MKHREGDSDLERLLREKEEELEIFRAGMDQTLLELNELKLNGHANDDVLDGQIDVIMQDSLQKINEIIDSVLQSGVQRVDDALYELDSSMQAGNQNATGPYVLSQIENASTSTMEFSTAFNNFIADGHSAKHAEVISAVNNFAGAIVDVLINTKGLTRFASDDNKADQLINGARASATSTIRFFRNVQSVRMYDLDAERKIDVVINNSSEVVRNLQSLSKLADAFAPKSKLNTNGDLGEVVDDELTKAANAIQAAADRLAKLKNKPRDQFSTYELKIHDSILDAAIAVTNAIAQLIKAATASQQEIVREGRGSMTVTQFYKKHNRWTEGLISAAKAVATSTNMLIETADGVISGRNSPEQLIVASNDVAASTAQLVAASRVKATFMSKTQDKLETASKTVTAACRALVRQVQDIIAQKNRDDGDVVDYTKLSDHEFKVRQMEQQVCIHPIKEARAIANKDHRSRSSSSRTSSRKHASGSARCASCLTWKSRLDTAIAHRHLLIIVLFLVNSLHRFFIIARHTVKYQRRTRYGKGSLLVREKYRQLVYCLYQYQVFFLLMWSSLCSAWDTHTLQVPAPLKHRVCLCLLLSVYRNRFLHGFGACLFSCSPIHLLVPLAARL